MNPNIASDPNDFISIATANENCEIIDLHLEDGATLKWDKVNVKLWKKLLEKSIQKEADDCVKVNYRNLVPPIYLSEQTNASTVNANAETHVVHHMATTTHLQRLLLHPVVSSFLCVKWYLIQEWFYYNLLFYTTFCFVLVAHIALHCAGNDEATFVTKIFLFLFLCLLTIRELAQLAMRPKYYVKKLENWIEVVLIIVTACSFIDHSQDEYDLRKIYHALSILLATYELVLMMGQIPSMAVNMKMLQTVSTNFIKFFAMNAVIIFAFVCCFFVLFHTDGNVKRVDENVSPQNQTNSSAENDIVADDFWSSFMKNLFTTIVMMTGEFNSADIRFDEEHVPVTGRLIFILFVFLVSIVLLNLLNGLAISDIQAIRNEALLIAKIARVEQLVYYEYVLFTMIKLFNSLNQRLKFETSIDYKKFLISTHLKDYRLNIYIKDYSKNTLKFDNYTRNAIETWSMNEHFYKNKTNDDTCMEILENLQNQNICLNKISESVMNCKM